MRSCLASLLALAALLGAPDGVRAQSVPAGNVSPNKDIYTKIYISVGDALSPPYPIQGVRLVLVSAGEDTIRLTTDGAGAARRFIPRGMYRLLTMDWVTAGGRDYKWNLPVSIAPGMRDIVLTAGNARRAAEPIVAESPGEVGLGQPIAPADSTVNINAAAPNEINGRRRLIDSTGMSWEVFEERFIPSAVAHTDLPLPTVQVVLLFNREDETRELEHFPANWRSLSDSALAVWLAKSTRIRP